MDQESILEGKLLAIVILDQVEGLHVLGEALRQEPLHEPHEVVIQTVVNLLDGLSLVEMVVRFNDLRLDEVREVDLLLEELLDDLLPLCGLESVETESQFVVKSSLDEGSRVHLSQRSTYFDPISGLQQLLVRHPDTDKDLLHSVIVRLEVVADDVTALLESELL